MISDVSHDGFIRVGRLAEFRLGRGRMVRVAGERVAVFNAGGRLSAIQDACPHMGASLAEGRLDGSRVICHWHGWSFDLGTGQGKERSWACARVYEVRVEGDEVWLKPPPPAPPPEPEVEPPWVSFDPERHLRKPS